MDKKEKKNTRTNALVHHKKLYKNPEELEVN